MRLDARASQLARLIDNREVGQYTLPEPVLDAYDNLLRVQALSVPEIVAPDLYDVATAIATDPSVDFLELAQAVSQARVDAAARDVAVEALARAADVAAGEAITVAVDYSPVVIEEHLAPAYSRLLEETRTVGQALAGYELTDTHGMVTAPTAVRKAYAALPGLVNRRSLIMHGRFLANQIGGASTQRDVAGLYVEFRRPMTFWPNRPKTSRIPDFAGPEDPTQRLLWIATDPTAQAAEPWLPTAEQQDAAWWEEFGPGIAERDGRAHDARGILSAMS